LAVRRRFGIVCAAVSTTFTSLLEGRLRHPETMHSAPSPSSRAIWRKTSDDPGPDQKYQETHCRPPSERASSQNRDPAVPKPPRHRGNEVTDEWATSSRSCSPTAVQPGDSRFPRYGRPTGGRRRRSSGQDSGEREKRLAALREEEERGEQRTFFYSFFFFFQSLFFLPYFLISFVLAFIG